MSAEANDTESNQAKTSRTANRMHLGIAPPPSRGRARHLCRRRPKCIGMLVPNFSSQQKYFTLKAEQDGCSYRRRRRRPSDHRPAAPVPKSTKDDGSGAMFESKWSKKKL